MAHGGKRPNSGPKRGTKYAPTLSKEAAREVVRQRVLQAMEPMIAAQVAHAQGLKYLVARHKTTGKFERLTEDDTQRLLAGEESDHVLIEVWEKDPSVQAFTDLMNRALDKPKEQAIDINLTADMELTQRLASARARVKSSKG